MLDLCLNQLTLDQLALIAGALFTFLTALGALLSARATKKATQAQFYRSLFEDYSSERMEDELRELERLQEEPKWKELVKKYPEGGSKFREKLGNLYEARVTSDRRYVKYYFISAPRLRKLKFIRKGIFKKQAAVAGVDLLYDV